MCQMDKDRQFIGGKGEFCNNLETPQDCENAFILNYYGEEVSCYWDDDAVSPLVRFQAPGYPPSPGN